jgi:hypothetical protein
MSSADRLDMAYINSLPQPFHVRQYGEKAFCWPVHDIDVETGLVRIDVCGKLDILHISDIAAFLDMSGREHQPDGFYVDALPEERECAA